MTDTPKEPFEAVSVGEDTTRDLLAALRACEQLFAEALPKFNWGASALDANAIRLLNETPLIVRAAITRTTGATHV